MVLWCNKDSLWPIDLCRFLVMVHTLSASELDEIGWCLFKNDEACRK